MLRHLTKSTAIGSVSYLVLSFVFFIFCTALGHNKMEMLYGDTAAVLLAMAAGVLYTWLSAAAPVAYYKKHTEIIR